MGRFSAFKLDAGAVDALKGFRNHAKSENDVDADRRALAILMIGHYGYTRQDAAVLCDASLRSVFGWQNSYQERGLDGLREQPIPGRPPRLNEKQLAEFAELVRAGPEAAGYQTGLWTSVMRSSLIKREFQVEYSPSQVRRILHKLGFSIQFPKKNWRERTTKSKRSG